MTKAEEKALKIFPVKKVPYYGLTCNAYSERDANLDKRALFCMGYETAEKDLGLTWEDVSLLNNIRTEEINRIVSESKDGIVFTDNDELSKIVLKKFNKIKGNE